METWVFITGFGVIVLFAIFLMLHRDSDKLKNILKEELGESFIYEIEHSHTTYPIRGRSYSEQNTTHIFKVISSRHEIARTGFSEDDWTTKLENARKKIATETECFSVHISLVSRNVASGNRMFDEKTVLTVA